MTLLTLLAMLACPGGVGPEVADFVVETRPGHRVADLPVTVVLTAVDGEGERVAGFCGTLAVDGLTRVSGLERAALDRVGPFEGGRVEIPSVTWDGGFTVGDGERHWRLDPDTRTLPGFLSILPPVIAIALAIWLRQALLALLAGIWLGAFFIHGFNPLSALLRTADTYLPRAVASSDHAAIILFTLALGGMVGILSRSGSTRALIDRVAARARTRRSGMLASWASGLVVFFDDYANCLLVGNTMRPLTDRLRISREKLAFIVDSTAAPVATVAVVSTWIGYQLGLFEGVIPGQPYDNFLRLLPYSFYSFFTIAFVVMIAASGRDFGPMLRAERRAMKGEVLRPGATPLMDRELTEMEHQSGDGHLIDAVIGIGAVIVIVFAGIYLSGRSAVDEAAGFREIIGAANSYAVLLWAGFGGSLAALLSALIGGRLTLTDGMEAWVAGVKAMVMAVLILVLAWGIGDMCQNELLTGPWVLSQIQPDPRWIPALTFVVSGFVALATGSSFSTMAIVIPIVGPLAWALTGDAAALDASAVEGIRYGTLAAVLSGAVFGDHCSPISDTTIMSSMASASDHIDHVRTQAPYALLCAGAAGLLGFIPAGFGVPWFVSLALGLAALAATLWWLGKDPAAD